MTTRNLQVMVPAPVAMPRGAVWAAQAVAWLAQGVWRALADHGRHKAAHELTTLARQREALDPEMARQLHEAARSAAAVRQMADGYRRSDPGFASDLYAAANRHEAQADAIGTR
jgi:hypothetical protein